MMVYIQDQNRNDLVKYFYPNESYTICGDCGEDTCACLWNLFKVNA